MQIKKKISCYKIGFLLSVFLLTSCGVEIVTKTETISKTDLSVTSTTTDDCQNPCSSQIFSGEINFDIYSLNDFHGSTKYIDGTYPEIGLAKLSTIFRALAERNTSFILSAGDMWQETIESNLNRGEYVTKAMNRIGFDAMTLGNHEFDWGDVYIKSNAEIAEFPFLCANLIEKESGEMPDFVQGSTIIEKDGVKMGVIGAIGQGQYNDISLNRVYKYSFEQEDPYIINESKKLREQGVDIVVLSTHDPYTDENFNLAKKKLLNEAKIDAVITGHSHEYQDSTYTREDGQIVPIVQAYSNGKDYAHLNFTVNKDTHKLVLNTHEVKDFKKYKDVDEDQFIIDLYENYYNVDDIKNEEVCNVVGSMSSYKEVPNLASTIMYNLIKNDSDFSVYDIQCAIHNQGRENIASGILTYEYLFKALPFDNEIVLFKCDWKYIQNTARSSSRFFNKEFDEFERIDGEFYVAAIDYVGYKYANMISVINTGYYIRDVVYDYLKEKREIVASDFSY